MGPPSETEGTDGTKLNFVINLGAEIMMKEEMWLLIQSKWNIYYGCGPHQKSKTTK